MAYTDNAYTADAINNLTGLLSGAIEAQAMRPQKTSTYTTSTSTPYALADMIANRDKIGQARQNLDTALKAREDLGYTLANALANVPQQQGYGSWLSDFARSFGGGFASPTNTKIDRAQKAYENEMKDLAQILAYDKAMGDIQTQRQNIGYTPMEYGTGKGQGAGGAGAGKRVAEMEITSGNLGDLFQTIAKNPYNFSTIGVMKQGERSRALRSAVTSQGLTDMGHREFAYLQSIMPQGFATAINTAAEQKIMRPYTTQFESGAGSAKKAAIKNMIGGIYDEYAREAKAQGLEMPMTKEQYVNSRINAGRVYNPKYYTGESDKMYLDDENNNTNQVQQNIPSENDIAEEFMKGTI